MGGKLGLVLDLVLVFLLALSPLVPFGRLFAEDASVQITIVDGDFTEEFLPVLITAARALKGGEWPLWNPFSNGGQPLLADPQAALFYPPTWWALSGIGDRDGASLVALERLVPLHLALAAVFTYLLGRVALGSRVAAVVAGLVFAYSGFLTSYPIEQLPILRAAAWFPLQVAALWLALKRSLVPWALLAGLALGISVLAGHPQTTFLEGVGLAVVAGVWTYHSWAQERRFTWRPLAGVAVAGVVGLAVGAAQIIPSAEFAAVSNRSQVDFRFLAGGFALWELPLDLWAPRIFGGRPPFVGLIALVLGAVALATGGGRALWAASALALVGLCLSTGAHTFLYGALYNLAPGFALFRGQERSVLLFALGLALLAGYGASRLAGGLSARDLRRLRSVRQITTLALLVAVGLAAALYWRAHLSPTTGEASVRWGEVIRSTAFAAAMLAAGLAILTLRASAPALRPILPLLIVGFVAVELLAIGWQAHVQARPADIVYPASSLVERATAGLGFGRVYDEWVLRGNHGLAYGLPTITRTFPIHLERLSRATDRLTPDRLFDLLNVRYVTTWRDLSPEREPLVRVGHPTGGHFLYGRGPLGPAWVAGIARLADSPQDALDMVAQDNFDPRSTVVLEQLGPLMTGAPGRVTSYRRGWSTVEAVAEAPRGGYLVVSEMAYPSWRARLDGVEVPLLHADYLLQAVWLPPGAHRLELTFDHTRVLVGVAISAAALLMITLSWVIAAWQPGRAGRSKPVTP